MFFRLFVVLFWAVFSTQAFSQTADLEIRVDFDFFPSETSWTLISASSGLVASSPAIGYTISNPNVLLLIPVACGQTYTFTISDQNSDGMSFNPVGGYGLQVPAASLVLANQFNGSSFSNRVEIFTLPLALCANGGPHNGQQSEGTTQSTQTTLQFTSVNAHRAVIGRLMRCRSDDVLDEEERRRRILSRGELDESDACPSFEAHTDQARWNLWANAGFTEVDGSQRSADAHIVNGVVGLDYKLDQNWVIGALAGYEWSEFDFASTNGSLDGQGLTIAAYAGVKIDQYLTADVLVGHSWLHYNNDVAGDRGDFDASRWMLSGNVTGHYLYKKYMIEPNLHGQFAWEKQDGYTTSGSTIIASQKLTVGRVAFGPRISRDHLMDNGTNAEFWGSIEGEYDFTHGSTTSSNILDSNGVLSARLSAGVDFDLSDDISFQLDGSIGGIGQQAYTTYQGNLRLSVGF